MQGSGLRLSEDSEDSPPVPTSDGLRTHECAREPTPHIRGPDPCGNALSSAKRFWLQPPQALDCLEELPLH